VDILSSVGQGFAVAFAPINLALCFVGVLIGTLVGVLPGLGPVAAMSLLLPVSFHVPPVGAVILLAGIYYGAMYGGSTTSILVRIPGEAASIVTCLDGYQMALQGRAGPALGISAFASFIAGTVSVLALMLVAPPLAEFALRFGPPEYFALMVVGLTILALLASGPLWKALVMTGAGLVLGSIGIDSMGGTPRYTFGILELADGIGLAPVVMGLFGVAEVLVNLERTVSRSIVEGRIAHLLPTRRDWADSAAPIARGSVLGFLLGILPGGGAIVSSFASYALEKALSKRPDRFGKGAVEGVAGPEAANNAAATGAFVPLFTLGLPANSVMAVLLGAMIVHGMQPGPMLLAQKPDLFWGAVTSMYMGNAMLLVLNLPLIGLWVRMLKIPYSVLCPFILLFCLIGVYSLNNSVTEVLIMVACGAIGYLCRKFAYEPAPLVLALVLGPMLEMALRRSLLISGGDAAIFVTRPIAAALLVLAAAMLLLPLVPAAGKRLVTLTDAEL
jgi:putative tricarboxylic transport membrane protein